MGMRRFSNILMKEEGLCIRTDNTVTEYCLRKWKGKGKLLPLVRKVRILVKKLTIRIQMEHIMGINNSIADSLSRMEISGDYKLDPEVLKMACKTLNIYPSIDGFAQRTNRQRIRYCCWLMDKKAVK
jgi:hypothetical protein